MADDVSVVTPAPAPVSTMKPGYKTTEFWLSAVATFVGMVVASGIVPSTGPWTQVVGLVTCFLAALGYTVPRMSLKAGSQSNQ